MLADIVFPARSWPRPQSEDCLLSFCQRHTVSNRAAAEAAKAGRIHSLLKLWAARGWIRVWNDAVDFLALPPWNILGNTKVTCGEVKRLALSLSQGSDTSSRQWKHKFWIQRVWCQRKDSQSQGHNITLMSSHRVCHAKDLFWNVFSLASPEEKKKKKRKGKGKHAQTEQNLNKWKPVLVSRLAACLQVLCGFDTASVFLSLNHLDVKIFCWTFPNNSQESAAR